MKSLFYQSSALDTSTEADTPPATPTSSRACALSDHYLTDSEFETGDTETCDPLHENGHLLKDDLDDKVSIKTVPFLIYF